MFDIPALAHLRGDHHQQAVDLARDGVRRRPDLDEAHVLLASALGHLDRADEAGGRRASQTGILFTNVPCLGQGRPNQQRPAFPGGTLCRRGGAMEFEFPLGELALLAGVPLTAGLAV